LSNGEIMIECGREHLNGFMRYAELADTIARWLEDRYKTQGPQRN
jgi:hypothetical protein